MNVLRYGAHDSFFQPEYEYFPASLGQDKSPAAIIMGQEA